MRVAAGLIVTLLLMAPAWAFPDAAQLEEHIPLLRPLATPQELRPGLEHRIDPVARDFFNAVPSQALSSGLPPEILALLGQTEPEPQPESCEPDGDVPDAPADARVLLVPSVCRGLIHDDWEDSDLYAIDVAQGQGFSAGLRIVEGGSWGSWAYLCVYSPGHRLYVECEYVTAAGEPAVIGAGGKAGRWFVEAYSWRPGTTYDLVLDEAPDPGTLDDCATGDDASDSARGATPISYPVTCDAELRFVEGSDWYALALPADEWLEIRISPQGPYTLSACAGDPDLWLYDCASSPAPGLPATVHVRTDVPGNWVFGLGSWDEGDIPYEIHVAPTAPTSQDDCGGGDDASWRQANATIVTLAIPFVCDAALDPFDRLDWYTLALGQDEVVQVQVHEQQGDYAICTLDPRGTIVDCGAYAGGPAEVHAGGEAGAWTLAVIHWQGARGGYALEVKHDTRFPVQDDCGTGGDAGDYRDVPTVLSFPFDCMGILHKLDALDWFTLSLAGDTYVEMSVHGGTSVWACAFRPDGTLHRCVRDGAVYLDSVGTPGNWTIVAVHTAHGPTVEYAFSVLPAPDPAPQDDCGTGGDASNLPDVRTTIPSRVSCSGMLHRDHFDHIDHYGFEVANGTTFRVEVHGAVTAYLIAPDGSTHRPATYLTAQQDDSWSLVVYTHAVAPTPYGMSLRMPYVTQAAYGEFVTSHWALHVNERIGPSPADGVDGTWHRLDQTAEGGEEVWFERHWGLGAYPTLAFYDEDLQPIDGAPCRTGTGVTCHAPEGAVWIHVNSSQGYAWSWTVYYRYLQH